MSVSELSERERECLSRVARLQDSKTIARDLGLSSKTVDGHIERAVRKLGAKNRRDAARMLGEPVWEPFPRESPPVAPPPDPIDAPPAGRVREPHTALDPGPAFSPTGGYRDHESEPKSPLTVIGLVIASALGLVLLLLAMPQLAAQAEQLAKHIMKLRHP